jgi:hypothetical protein
MISRLNVVQLVLIVARKGFLNLVLEFFGNYWQRRWRPFDRYAAFLMLCYPAICARVAWVANVEVQ